MDKTDVNPTPLVSVIMPAYNAARFLAEAVASVQAQTYPHWELIIIDDASTDATPDAIESVIDDPRIRSIRVPRIGGPAGVRNKGLELAQGDFIAFLDADDLYRPDALATLLAPLLADPIATAAYGFTAHMDETGKPLPERDMLLRDGLMPAGYAHTWERIILGQISCLLPALMLRRSTLERVGRFNVNLCGPEDFEFYVRLFRDDFGGVRCLPNTIYHYRIYHASLTKDPARYATVVASGLKIVDWLFADGTLPRPMPELKRMAYLGCYRHFSRERLVEGQPALARRIATQALLRGHMTSLFWARHLLPIVVRSFLPAGTDKLLVQYKAKRRKRAVSARPQLVGGAA